MRENEVEKQFVAAVRAVGGQALKFTSQTKRKAPAQHDAIRTHEIIFLFTD